MMFGLTGILAQSTQAIDPQFPYYCPQNTNNFFDFSLILNVQKRLIVDGYCTINFNDFIIFNTFNKTTIADGYCSINPVNAINEGYVNRVKLNIADGYCPISFSDVIVFNNIKKIDTVDGYCSLLNPS